MNRSNLTALWIGMVIGAACIVFGMAVAEWVSHR